MSLVDSFEKAVVKLRRRRIAQNLFDQFDGEVQRGPFAGLKLDRNNTASKGLLALKIFGLYESVVIDAIVQSGPYSDLINIGACDGYFTLGLLKSGLVKRSICFETFEKRQQAIRRYAAANELSEQVFVLGEATESIGDDISRFQFDAQNSLLICDIEGAEFELLSRGFMQQLQGTTMIIELHDRLNSRSTRPRDELIDRLPDGYQHQILTWQPPDFGGISELDELTDNDLALVLSEGRKVRGEWLFAWPATRTIRPILPIAR